MNGSIGNSSPLNPALGREGAHAQLRPGGKKRAFLQIDLRRSLWMQRRLALGVVVVGLVATLLYLVRFWSGYAAHTIVYIAPHASASDALLIRNAIYLLLAFAALGILAAVVADKLDPRIYIAADLELLTGIAPMATLPDFSEVPEKVADEYLVPLASAIENAFKGGRLKKWVFVGAGSGAGVTTVTNRVREMLQTQGLYKSAAAKVAAPALELTAGGSEEDADARLTAMLQRVVEEVDAQEQSLVLSEAAPLVASTETEQMVRSADCVVVVVQSGATTRAQLLETTSSLQRLNPAVVQLVLNRVSLAKADLNFRRSVRQIARHSPRQDRGEEQMALRLAQVVAEPVPTQSENALRAVTEAPESPTMQAPVNGTHKLQAPLEPPGSEPPAESLEKFNPYMRAIEHELPPVTKLEAQQSGETPWWSVEPLALPDSSLTQPRPMAGVNGKVPPNESKSGESVQELAQQAYQLAHEQTKGIDTHFPLPRLSGLRGGLFLPGIRQLDYAKHAAQYNAEAELLLKQIAPYEALIAQAMPARNPDMGPETQVEDTRATLLTPLNQTPETKAEPNATNKIGEDLRNGGPEKNTAAGRDGSLPAPADESEISPKRKPIQSGPDRVNGVQILPSKRGQYKRKG